jgi:hypothetical protein
MENPYRQGPTQPKYICGICWKTASIMPSQCCGQDRLPMDSEETENNFRAELQRRRNVRKKRDTRIITAGVVIGAPLLCWLTGDWVSILADALGLVAGGAMLYHIVIRAEGWPNAWLSPLPSLLRFMQVQVVDLPKQ